MASKEMLNKLWSDAKKRADSKLLKRPRTSQGLVHGSHEFSKEQSKVTFLKHTQRPTTARAISIDNELSQRPIKQSWSKTKSLILSSNGKAQTRKKTMVVRKHHSTTKEFSSSEKHVPIKRKTSIQKKKEESSISTDGISGVRISPRRKKSKQHIRVNKDTVIDSPRQNDENYRYIDTIKGIDSKDIQIKRVAWVSDQNSNSPEMNSIDGAAKSDGAKGDRDQWNLLVEDLLDEEGGYDTDVELEFKEKPPEKYDITGKMLYLSLCKENELVPVSYFVNGLNQSTFKMRHHGLGSTASKAIAQALIKNTIVETLDLRDNFLEPEGGMAFAGMLHENFYITDLDLSDNFLHSRSGIAFAQVLKVNASIKRLVLQGNHFTDKVAKAFAEVLKENRTLQELDLSYNEFGEQGGLFLGAGLALNYGLKALSLKWNSIRGKGAVSLAAALKTNDCLVSLDVSWNGFAFVGALALSRHLRKNESLRELDISNNRLGLKSAVKLAPAVKLHPNLRSFRIGRNPIGDDGVEAILTAVKKNSNIKELGLDDITVSPSVHDEILQLEESRDIVIITGGLGGFAQRKPPPSGMEILVQFMQDNRLRLKDLFFQFDKDHSGDITREEFKKGLKETGIEMSEKQLNALIELIDVDKNNLIEYSEVLHGRDLILRERRFQRKVAIRTAQREKESIQLPKLAGFEE